MVRIAPSSTGRIDPVANREEIFLLRGMVLDLAQTVLTLRSTLMEIINRGKLQWPPESQATAREQIDASFREMDKFIVKMEQLRGLDND
jgi:hypothetical protein